MVKYPLMTLDDWIKNCHHLNIGFLRCTQNCIEKSNRPIHKAQLNHGYPSFHEKTAKNQPSNKHVCFRKNKKRGEFVAQLLQVAFLIIHRVTNVRTASRQAKDL